MPVIPRDGAVDGAFTLAREGYRFLGGRHARLRSDVFRMRLLGQPVISMHGPAAAGVFYDPERFERAPAVPGRVAKTLFGQGGVQSLDGEAHASRKAMFMSLMTPRKVEDLVETTADRWRAALGSWRERAGLVLFDEVQQVLCRAACAWAGVPLREEEVARRSRDLGAMVEAFAAVGPRHWRGRQARHRCEDWIGDMLRQDRNGDPVFGEGTPAATISSHRNPDGDLLDERVAAVEVLNLVRPIVAISYFVVFAALALHDHPGWRERLETAEDQDLEAFVQEVRRVAPFAPFVGAQVRRDFDWQGYRFPAGTLALLDIYGANHDPGLWRDPESFLPDRFRDWKPGAFDFIPQGGGPFEAGHRCAGEWITIGVMKVAVAMLTRSMTYTVPTQDLTVSLRRVPALPTSRFVVRDVA